MNVRDYLKRSQTQENTEQKPKTDSKMHLDYKAFKMSVDFDLQLVAFVRT